MDEGRTRAEQREGRRTRGGGVRAIGALAALEARRTASLPLLALLAGATYVAARGGGAVGAEPLLAELALLEGDAPAAAGLARASAASLGLALAALALVVHAAGLVTRWRQGDGDWLGARPIGPTAALAAALLGLALGAAALVAAVGVGTLGAARQPAREVLWRAGPAGHLVVHPGEQYVEEVRGVPLPEGALVRVRVQNTALDVPYGDATLLLVRSDGGRAEVRARIARRGHVEAPMPPGLGSDALVVALSALGPGTLAVAGSRPVELLGPPRSPLWVDAALGARALALLVAAAALAAGLGAWVAAPLAALATLAAAVGVLVLAPEARPALAPALAHWCPGAGLGAALDAAAAGLRPPLAPAGHAAGAAAVALAALALARAALGSWRHAP